MSTTKQSTTKNTTRKYPTQIPELLDYQALKHYYGLFESTISKLVMNGKFTDIVKVGRKNYFKKTDVEVWIAGRTIKAGA